jgi:hypothetical protein
VEDETRMARQPCFELQMLVGGVIVDNDVDDLAGRDLGFDGVEEADELLMPVARQRRNPRYREAPIAWIKAPINLRLAP